MKGLELSEHFYFKIVKPLIDTTFPALKNRYAAGLIGYGSDVLGNDDLFSRDHEWGPRCHIWLTPEDYTQYGDSLNTMLLSELPLTYKGYPTFYTWSDIFCALIGTTKKENATHYVAITTVPRHLFIQFSISLKDISYGLSPTEWLCIPEQKLLELTRGKIFEDPLGQITFVRNIFSYYPEDIWTYKMLYCWNQISNFELIPLCATRGDLIGAKICLNQILEHIIRLTYLYNRTYYPSYIKWFGYEFSKLPKVAPKLAPLITLLQSESDIPTIMTTLETVLTYLISQHNQLNLTPLVKLEPHPSTRDLCNISARNICNALNQIIPKELSTLPIQGSCDQWLTNPDLLLWSENFSKLKDLYQNTYTHRRDGIGDLII